MNFPQIAQQVIDKLGGKENIATAAHCATRLRIVLNDESKVDKEGIDNIEGVKGQIATFGERLSGYFRANHSGNRRRRFVNGYSLHAYSERFLR